MTTTVQLRLTLATAPALGGDDFVEAPANAEARARISAWRDWPGLALALCGPPGSGKTHLAQLWAQDAGAALLAGLEPPPPGSAAWIDAADRRLADTPEAAELVFHLLNRAARGEGALLLVGREPPAAWTSALPDLRSRLNALPVALLGEPDDALLRRLLLKFFRERAIRPGEDLLAYLVRRIERSARSAAEVVEALDLACRAGARLGRPLARELLHDPADDPPDDGDADDDETAKDDARG